MTLSSKHQSGFLPVWEIIAISVAIVGIFLAYRSVKSHEKSDDKIVVATQETAPNEIVEPQVETSWHRGESGVWEASNVPPTCPEQPIFSTPVDISLATSILYPGQVRGTAFKAHGGFRFDNQPTNEITLTVPMDAKLVRAAKGLFPENGEVQYGFELIAPCGIWYSFGHIHTLSPKFQEYADKIPLVSDRSQPQFYDVTPSPSLTKGEVIATEVGIEHTKIVFVEWQVNDLRHKNGLSIRSAWAKYKDEFDEYAVCWLDMLPAQDAAKAKALPGGDSVSGKKSDYCR